MKGSFQITFDCADPGALSRFWADVLGYKLQDPPPGFDTWEDALRARDIPEERWNDASAIVDPDGAGVRMYFQRVPEPKSAKNRVHLDLNVGVPREAAEDERRRLVGEAAARAMSLGATKLYDKTGEWGEYWITLTDPEGNEFCMQ